MDRGFATVAYITTVRAILARAIADTPIPIRVATHPGAETDLFPRDTPQVEGMRFIVVQDPNLIAARPGMAAIVGIEREADNVGIVAADMKGKRLGACWSDGEHNDKRSEKGSDRRHARLKEAP